MEDIGRSAAQADCLQEPTSDALGLPSTEGHQQTSSCSSVSDSMLFNLSPEWQTALQSLAKVPSLGVFTKRWKRAYEDV